MFRMHRLFAVLLAVVVAWVAPSAFATQVTPSERVTGHVNVREFPATQDSAVVGQLAVGQAAELLEVIPYWYRDANGKARDESGPGTPAHVEAKLLALEHQHPGTLKADILKVPHHGSETASTQAFIDAVDPSFVLISASTNHHLPRLTVLQRYEKPGSVVLRTDANRAKNTDHIYCASSQHGQVDCNYRDQFIP